ncbi:MAG TPA: AAA domain-containing protein [Terriglobales bacterium]|nr:AAA domain-containing protein [Terriglobales bacterium]
MKNKTITLETIPGQNPRQNGHRPEASPRRRLQRAPEGDKLRVARDKITRVFRYLEALNQHRNPVQRHLGSQPWRLWLHDLPCHSSIERGLTRAGSAALNPDDAGLEDDEIPRVNVPRIEVPRIDAQRRDKPGGGGFVFKVRRPRLSAAPEPPREVLPWLKEGWDDPAKEVALHETRNEAVRQGDVRAERFADNPARVAVFRRWKLQRDEWSENEAPARVSMKIFESLYELHGRMEREAERVELILGDGILSWPRAEGDIYHPVLLQRLQLEFNAAAPEFILSEAEYPVELYSALFQTLSDVDGRAVGRCREELEQKGYHPLAGEVTSGFLKRLVVQLSPRGEFIEECSPRSAGDEPRICRDPIVFLRARTLGFASAIEGVLEDLRTRPDLPWSLLNIVGEEAPIFVDGAATEATGFAPRALRQAEAEVLLSKPANPEQIRIAQQLEEHGGVLVQGPPGTGKTHTIGNLIGHLLAQGKSVLVTSHTTKALRMVRHHIVPGLRPLCVSVLESDLDSRRQLESAVAAIAERLSSAEPGSLEHEAGKLQAERHALLQELDSILQQLAEARADEYREIMMDGKSWTPADAARAVTQDRARHGWIPGPIQAEVHMEAQTELPAEVSLPLSQEELSELYRTNVSLSTEDEHELSGNLPELTHLPTPENFAAAVCERDRLRLEDLDLRYDLWQTGAAQGSEQQVEALVAKLIQAVEPLSGKERWKLAAVYAGKYGGSYRQPWDQLVAMVQLVHREAADAQEVLLQYGPVLPVNNRLEEQEQIVTEILAHLEQGGKLGSFVLWKHKPWAEFVATARINGGRPRLIEHFQALRQLCRLQVLRQNLALRWDRQVAPLGAALSNQMGEAVENTLIQFCAPIQDCLRWHDLTWAPLRQELEDLGFLWNKFIAEQPVCIGPYGELTRIERAVVTALVPVLFARLEKLRLQKVESQLQALNDRLELARQNFTSSPAIARLVDAVRHTDSSHYSEAHARLAEILGRRADFDLRHALLNKLESAAPAWAGSIRNRESVHGGGEIPGDAMRAWSWRRLNDELERRAGASLDALQSQSEKLREQLRQVTINLIDRRAWAHQARRTSPHQRQALIGWLDTIRRIGKGTGIRVPLLRAEAARKMSECRSAVPVWVMPLSRVVENFDPRTTRFDVVIIDEASQSDVMALLALYLGKTVLVVGDHEQVSPTAVGQDLGMVGNLISQYLHGIPNAHLYDGQISIYDLARQSFGGTTCLVEHFRSVPEIIQFSNTVSYDRRVKPLRDASRVQLRPHLVSYRVPEASRDEKINHPEALAVTSLIAAAIEQPEYQINEAGRPVSFGVVSLIGDEQAIEIDRLLRTHVSPDRYEMHRLLCGNAAQFQGDERDVVFISMVDTAERGTLRLRDQQIFKQRFNVAASRARDQMWIVHSLNPERDLKDGDLRRQLIEHAYDPSHLMRALEEGGKEKKPQTAFERELMKRLEACGYKVTSKWQVGAYRIDLVVEGKGKRLAIECDGDPRHPVDITKLSEDMERQAVLERLGWIFTRVRATEFFRDAERAMQPVFGKLHALEIYPESGMMDRSGSLDLSSGRGATQVAESQAAIVTENIGSENEEPQPSGAADLIARVIHRADELRREWGIAVAQDRRAG